MRTILLRLLPIIRILCGVLMLWKGCAVATNSPQPLHVVISNSMHPAFQRGDIIFISNWQKTIQVGDIPVVWFSDQKLPMVHRAVDVKFGKDAAAEGEAGVERQLILTKGDNNPLTDVALYPKGRVYVHREEIIGLVRGYVPFLGYITIALNDYPAVKYVLIGGLVAVAVFA